MSPVHIMKGAYLPIKSNQANMSAIIFCHYMIKKGCYLNGNSLFAFKKILTIENEPNHGYNDRILPTPAPSDFE